MKREGILDKLAARLIDGNQVSITYNSNGVYAEWDGNKIRLPKYCPEQEAREYIQNNWSKSVDEIKKYLKVKWGVTFIKNHRAYEVCSHGEYIGSMDYVKYVTKSDGDGVYSVNIFVPWFGLIKSGSIDSVAYDVEYYAGKIFELFKKCGTIFFINLNGKYYREKQNSLFVKPVSKEEFEKLLIDYQLYAPETILWKERYLSLERSVSSKEKEHETEINALKKQHADEIDFWKRRCEEESQYSDKLHYALQEHNNNRKPKIEGQIHFVAKTSNWRRVKRVENGEFIYHQKGFSFDENEGIEIIFLRKYKDKTPKQIVKKISSLRSKYKSYDLAIRAVNRFIKEWDAGNIDYGIKFVQRNFHVAHYNINLFKNLGDDQVPYTEQADLYNF